MKKISIVTIALVAACGSKAQVGDNASSTGGAHMCAVNADCGQGTFEDQQCGWYPCIDGVCTLQEVDAGTPCITGFVDNDASAPVWGSCQGGTCH